MAVEARVFRSDRRLHEIGRELIVAHIETVLVVNRRQNVAVRSNHLRRKLAVRILEFLKRRNVREGPDEQYHNQKQGNRRQEENPEPFDDFLFSIVSHKCDFFMFQSRKITQ